MKMPQTRRSTATAAERLGPVFQKLRTERGIPASKLSRETGLTRSYLNYLERGRFKDIGIERFVRLVQAMRLSADQVLGEIGYLPHSNPKLPEPEDYLRDKYKLGPADARMAATFLEFLARKSKRPRAEKEPRSRR